MQHLYAQVQAAVEEIRGLGAEPPKAGIILGTGLGGLARQIEASASIDYDRIPHFPRSTVASHRGQLICGRLAGLPIVAMEGRFHAYEGYALDQITLPVRVMKALGAELLIVSNAAGGMNPNFALGDIMFIDDHINLMGLNPLIGVNDESLGPRFPDMSRPYDPALIERGLRIARQADFAAHRGVFVAVTGPNLETRAEYRFLRQIGADAVGMSTVPEVILARQIGMRVAGFSIITNLGAGMSSAPLSHEQTMTVAASAAVELRRLLNRLIAGWGS